MSKKEESESGHSGDTESDWAYEDAAGTGLDAATVEFLDEVSCARSLAIRDGQKQLSANDFLEYLGINLYIEPQLAWIAREMCCAPMPPNAEMLVSKSNIVYFHDIENDYYTLEHPLTQRYLKVLERQRLDLIAMRSKPSVSMLQSSQPEMLFHNQFKHLQIPCQDCGQNQSAVHCEQCVMSFCQACFDILHSACEGPRKDHTFYQTSVGSLCSSCNTKRPQVFCATCADYFCFSCFESLHKKGYRMDHKAMKVSASDGDIVDEQRRCEECKDAQAAFQCDYCKDLFCVACFWRCHLNGSRRKHTITKISVRPLCNQCRRTRATVYCEQCQELLCTECFTYIHYKERMDPAFSEHMTRARPKVLWSVTQLQGWTRGMEARKNFRKRRDLVTKIQRRWRGAMTRRKLLGMLDHYKWRKKQINNYFMPKTRQERTLMKQRFASQLSKKEVAAKTSDQALRELRETVMATAGANPLEDPKRTQQTIQRTDGGGGAAEDILTRPVDSGMRLPRQPTLAVPVYSGYEGSQSRFKASAATTIGKSQYGSVGKGDDTGKKAVSSRFVFEQNARRSDLLTKDIRETNDLTLRQVMKIDDNVDAVAVTEKQYSPSRTSKFGSAKSGDGNGDPSPKSSVAPRIAPPQIITSHRSGGGARGGPSVD